MKDEDKISQLLRAIFPNLLPVAQAPKVAPDLPRDELLKWWKAESKRPYLVTDSANNVYMITNPCCWPLKTDQNGNQYRVKAKPKLLLSKADLYRRLSATSSTDVRTHKKDEVINIASNDW